MTGRSSPTDAATRMADALRPFQQRETGGDMPGRPQTGIHARILIDRSPTMAVWRDDLDAFARALIGLGAFRSVQIGDLPAAAEAQAWAASPGTIATAGAGGTDVHRVLILVSDCAAPRWRSPAWWQGLYALLHRSPTALINPLPPKLWRHVGIDLPAVRVKAPTAPAASNADLLFQPPPLLNALADRRPGGAPDGGVRDNRVLDGDVVPDRVPEAGPGGTSWLPLPVMSLTGHALGRWARTLTAESADGCDALLVPGPAAWDPPTPDECRCTPASLTASCLMLASPRAARLTVLCGAYEELDLPQLQEIAEAFEPEATSADIAEVLVGGLLSVTGGDPTTLRFRDGVREHIRSSLGVRDVRLLRERLPQYAERLVAGRHDSLPAAHPAKPANPENPVAEPATFDPGSRVTPAAPVAPVTPVAPVAPVAEPATDTLPPRSFGRHRSRPDIQPYFFLSYAHTPRFGAGGPDPDMWVERLFRDLSSHVMALTDLPAGAEAGFMDREIRSGEGWSERLGAALATCRTFVPLFSPRYFASEMCGKEWFAFAQRAVHHAALSNQSAEAIVPALWVPVPPSQLPMPAERLQFNHNAFGERYVTEGLYGLIKLRGYAEQYERAVYELAKRIVRVAETTRLGPIRPLDYRLVPSAFGNTTSRSVHIVVAAPTRHDLPQGRSPEYYGDSALDWNPYHPVSQRPIAHVTEDLIRNLNYQVTVSSFDDEAVHFDSKQPPTRPEILIVDRWAVEDEQRRQRLAAFDQESRPWINVVVPWNRYDHQSRAKESELAHRLEDTMPVKMSQGRAAVRAAANGVANMETLGQILPQVIEAATQQFIRHSQVYMPVGDTRDERPRLTGPMRPLVSLSDDGSASPPPFDQFPDAEGDPPYED